MAIGSAALAVIAGILSTLSPCVLPLLPVILGAAISEHRLGPAALAGGLALSFAAMLLLRRRHLALTEKAIQWPDALGLGLFTANGALVALDAGMPAIVAVLMGVITATFGGVLRDIVCNEIPAAFHDHRPYALCSFVGAWVLVLAVHLNAPQWAAISAAAATAVLLRGLALWTGWTLPAWRINAKR